MQRLRRRFENRRRNSRDRYLSKCRRFYSGIAQLQANKRLQQSAAAADARHIHFLLSARAVTADVSDRAPCPRDAGLSRDARYSSPVGPHTDRRRSHEWPARRSDQRIDGEATAPRRVAAQQARASARGVARSHRRGRRYEVVNLSDDVEPTTYTQPPSAGRRICNFSSVTSLIHSGSQPRDHLTPHGRPI